MIIIETVLIRGKQFTHTYSDAGFYIERNGTKYADALDLPEKKYLYIETKELIKEEA